MLDLHASYQVPYIPQAFDVDVVSAGSTIRKLSEEVKSSGVQSGGCFWKPEGFSRVKED